MEREAVIARDAEPIFNRNPYKRIDVTGRRCLREVIHQEDIAAGAAMPEPGMYDYDGNTRVWTLKR